MKRSLGRTWSSFLALPDGARVPLNEHPLHGSRELLRRMHTEISLRMLGDDDASPPTRGRPVGRVQGTTQYTDGDGALERRKASSQRSCRIAHIMLAALLVSKRRRGSARPSKRVVQQVKYTLPVTKPRSSAAAIGRPTNAALPELTGSPLLTTIDGRPSRKPM